MPTYVFKSTTGELRDFTFRVASRPDSFIEDGVKWTYDASETYRGVKTQHSCGWPMEFSPLSVMPWQVNEARKKYPEREYRDNGECVVRSKSHLETVAKKAGLVDRTRGRIVSSTRKKVKA